METFGENNRHSGEIPEYNRRKFIKTSILLGSLSGIAAGVGESACKRTEGDEEVTPSEDLMREHGVLNRILLIYDACRSNLIRNEQFDPTNLFSSAEIIRTFIEDYHEKLEEDYLFPRFEKAGRMTDLVNVLRSQHKAGRILTDQILKFGKLRSISGSDENGKLIKLLGDFTSMYRPHESREDTVLFPAIRKIVSRNEYFSLGEEFEDREHKLFGEDGFESMVDRVAGIEKQIGIYELSGFTPEI